MKNLKLSFALIIAVLAVGITFATKASVLGKKQVVGCFENITLQNQANTSQFTPTDALTCDQAKAAVGSRIYVNSAIDQLSPCDLPDSDVYCCVEIEPVTAAGTVPTLTLGGTTSQFGFVRIICKPQE